MAHVVTNKCVGCKFTDCVVVCPVACFYELERQLIIHPECSFVGDLSHLASSKVPTSGVDSGVLQPLFNHKNALVYLLTAFPGASVEEFTRLDLFLGETF